MIHRGYEAIVIGVSAGGMDALARLFSLLPKGFPLPIMVVQHMQPSEDRYLIEYLNNKTALTVKEADEKEPVRAGHIYIAPPGYHLLAEKDATLSLSIDPRVNYARPSIDVLFESAAYTWGSQLIGIVLTGANDDGAQGLRLIKDCGGLTIAQDPSTAEHPVMPQAAIDTGGTDRILTLEQIGQFLGSAFKS